MTGIFATGVVAAGGNSRNNIFHRQLHLLSMGVIAGVSIGDLFMGGFAPGIIMGISMCIVSFFISKKHGWQGVGSFSFKKMLIAFKDSFFALLTPVIIIGGIYGGIFTPTEAAAVAAVYGILVGLFIYKELKIKDFPENTFSGSYRNYSNHVLLSVPAKVLRMDADKPRNSSQTWIIYRFNNLVPCCLFNGDECSASDNRDSG